MSPPSQIGVGDTAVTPWLCPQRAWRRADGRDATREHLLMALADIDLFMIRASYSDQPEESRYQGEGKGNWGHGGAGGQSGGDIPSCPAD